jgi:hypothetical protein
MEETEKNGASALAKFLNQLNVPTLIAVVVMGGGNFFATKNSSEEQRQIVFRQIKDLHEALDEFESRQKQVLKNQAEQIQLLEQLSKQQPQ